jgi:hypothetical protein
MVGGRLHHTGQLLLHMKCDLGLVLMAGKAHAQKYGSVIDVWYAQFKSLIIALCGCAFFFCFPYGGHLTGRFQRDCKVQIFYWLLLDDTVRRYTCQAMPHEPQPGALRNYFIPSCQQRPLSALVIILPLVDIIMKRFADRGWRRRRMCS